MWMRKEFLNTVHEKSKVRYSVCSVITVCVCVCEIPVRVNWAFFFSFLGWLSFGRQICTFHFVPFQTDLSFLISLMCY